MTFNVEVFFVFVENKAFLCLTPLAGCERAHPEPCLPPEPDLWSLPRPPALPVLPAVALPLPRLPARLLLPALRPLLRGAPPAGQAYERARRGGCSEGTGAFSAAGWRRRICRGGEGGALLPVPADVPLPFCLTEPPQPAHPGLSRGSQLVRQT